MPRANRLNQLLTLGLLFQWFCAFVFAHLFDRAGLDIALFVFAAGTMAVAIAVLRGTERAMPLALSVSLVVASLLWLHINPGRVESYLIIVPCLFVITLYRDPNLLMASATTLLVHHAVCLIAPSFAPPGFDAVLAAKHAAVTLALLLLLARISRKREQPRYQIQTSTLLGRAVSPVNLPVPASKPAVAIRNANDIRGFHVLCVDDNPLILEAGAKMLESIGCTVNRASNGLEAVEAATRTHYDAIFMDCEMPEMNGYEATVEIRRREQGIRHTWIIALTGRVREDDRAICLVVGMDDYLAKPARTTRLREALQRSPAARRFVSPAGTESIAPAVVPTRQA